MKVGDLKKALADAPDDAEVHLDGEAHIEETTAGRIKVEAKPERLRYISKEKVVLAADFKFGWYRGLP